MNQNIERDLESGAKRCPFCGQKPKGKKNWYPQMIQIECVNESCGVRPSATIYEFPVRSNGDGTHTIDFEYAAPDLLEMWNNRAVI